MSLLFGARNLSCVRGATWTDTVRLVDEDTGEPINLAGVSAITMRVRRRINSDTVLLELTLANARLAVLDAADGTIGIDVSAAITGTLPEAGHRKAKYVFDCVLSRPSSVVEPGFKGRLSVYPQVTRLP